MHTPFNKKTAVMICAVLALILLSTLYFGFDIGKKSEVFRQPILGEQAIVDGTMKNEKVVTAQPLSPEASAAVTVQTSAVAVPTQTPPTTAQAFRALFSGKKMSSTDISGVIEMLNPAQGLIVLKDTQTGMRYTVFVEARVPITQGGEPLTFAALKVADIVHIRGAYEDTPQLVSATSIAIIGALPLPAAL